MANELVEEVDNNFVEEDKMLLHQQTVMRVRKLQLIAMELELESKPNIMMLALLIIMPLLLMHPKLHTMEMVHNLMPLVTN